ncbi:MAG: hypothetical protein AAGB06_01295 [Verrucomicrobiota bacterium]
MSRSFNALEIDFSSDSAAQNMADDICLQRFSGQNACVIARIYGWESGSKTFGRYQSFRAVAKDQEAGTLIRRPTGGGLVKHDLDFLTWSLCIPRAALLEERVECIFSQCQSSIRRSLNDLCGFSLRFADTLEKRPGDCFSQPVNNDLLTVDGRKISGIAMHRSQSAILLQGSLQKPGIEISQITRRAILHALCKDITGIAVEKTMILTTIIDAEQRAAAKMKCDSDAWLRARP